MMVAMSEGRIVAGVPATVTQVNIAVKLFHGWRVTTGGSAGGVNFEPSRATRIDLEVGAFLLRVVLFRFGMVIVFSLGGWKFL
jgi:hypothetical protein